MSKPSSQTFDTQSYSELISFLPERIWYLTRTGTDMWCRRPYSFFFTTSEAAERFARDMKVDVELTPIGMDAREMISDEGLQALRMQNVTRIFLDPSIDPDSGEVFGPILRLAETN